jgi:hypothetical protein
MTNLSLAAAAVLDASNLHPCKASCLILAAALRAAADQVVPNLPRPTEEGTRQFDTDIDYWEDCQQHRASLLAIADELEGVKYGTYRCEL